MKIAVEGCCHGELDKIYETLAYLEKTNNVKVDLLLICGDFQAVRNRSDLKAMAVPPKYQKLNTFYKYYSGETTAPVLTVFIGGNHEASNYLQELPYGGWVAPNIFYMGYAGVLNFGGVRIGGLSGIWKGRDHNRGHFEHPPYNNDTKRSCYHVRNLEVFRLKQLKQPIDIFLSHDWPRGIYHHGDAAGLIRRKTFFKDEINSNTLGSPVAEELLHKLQPNYWFAAHLHVKFAAHVKHKSEAGETKETKFLSLDKCLPRRKFLQVVDFPGAGGSDLQLELDPEWLAVLKSTNHLMSLSKANTYMPGPGCNERWDFRPTAQEVQAVRDDFGEFFKIPDNFERTAPPHNPNQGKKVPEPQILINPQTSLLQEMLGLTDPNAVFCGKATHNQREAGHLTLSPGLGDDSAYLDDSNVGDDSDFINSTIETSRTSLLDTTTNPDEISLDDLDEDAAVSGEEGGDAASQEEGSQGSSSEGSGRPAGTPPKGLTSSPLSTPPAFPRLGALPPPKASPIAAFGNTSPRLGQGDSSPSQCPLQPSALLLKSDSDSIDISMESTSSGSSPCKRNLSMDTEIVSTETKSVSTGPVQPKKFKRRNQSIYTAEDTE